MRWIAFLVSLGLIAQPPPLSAPGGLNVMVDGRPLGTFVSVAFQSGNGVVWSNIVSGSTVTIAANFNTAMLPTKDVLQSGACTLLNSTNGTVHYTYDLGPSCQVLKAYTIGERHWLKTDVPCPMNCWLQIGTLSQINIKRSDGTTDPGGQFDFRTICPDLVRRDGFQDRVAALTEYRREYYHLRKSREAYKKSRARAKSKEKTEATSTSGSRDQGILDDRLRRSKSIPAKHMGENP